MVWLGIRVQSFNAQQLHAVAWSISVWGLKFEFGVWGLGFTVSGFGLRVFGISGSVFRGYGVGFRIQMTSLGILI